jgi:hypothetical protein
MSDVLSSDAFKTAIGQRLSFTDFLLIWLIETSNGAGYDEITETMDSTVSYYATQWLRLREDTQPYIETAP